MGVIKTCDICGRVCSNDVICVRNADDYFIDDMTYWISEGRFHDSKPVIRITDCCNKCRMEMLNLCFEASRKAIKEYISKFNKERFWKLQESLINGDDLV